MKVKRAKGTPPRRPRAPSATTLQKELARTHKPDEAAEQETAASEILQVLSSSSSDLKRIFETLLANAIRLSDAKFGNLDLREEDGFCIAALHGAQPAHVDWRGHRPAIGGSEPTDVPLAPDSVREIVHHVPDLTKDEAYVERAPGIVDLVESAGARTLLSVPIVRRGNVIGAIVVYRQEVRPFADEQIALLKNFASQAVVAIERADLLKELSHGLFAQARTVSLAADQILFSAGDEGDGCYRVEEGLLKASVAEPGGDERILTILGPGSVVGELSMIDGAPRSATVTALRDSKLKFVSRSAFDTFGRSRPELFHHLTSLLANRLRDTNDALAATSFLSLKGRLARALLRLAEAFGREVGENRILIRQKVSQADLAAMAGIARESVSRVLNDWTSRSLVSRLSGYYCLEDKAALKREAED